MKQCHNGCSNLILIHSDIDFAWTKYTKKCGHQNTLLPRSEQTVTSKSGWTAHSVIAFVFQISSICVHIEYQVKGQIRFQFIDEKYMVPLCIPWHVLLDAGTSLATMSPAVNGVHLGSLLALSLDSWRWSRAIWVHTVTLAAACSDSQSCPLVIWGFLWAFTVAILLCDGYPPATTPKSICNISMLSKSCVCVCVADLPHVATFLKQQPHQSAVHAPFCNMPRTLFLLSVLKCHLDIISC